MVVVLLGDRSVVGVVAWLVVVVVGVVVCCNGGRDMSVQNNDSNRKTLSQRVTAL